jgi:hypothetical protein
MSEVQEAAKRTYDAASREIQKQLVTNQGGKRAETVYGQAYQALVAAGGAPQIKQKYRG